MGYDVMAAWDRQKSFEFNDIIQRRGGPWSGKIKPDSEAGRSISRDDYDPPEFNEATSRWSPPASPTGSFFPTSPLRQESPPPLSHSPDHTTPPRADSALQSPETSSLDKSSLGSKLYAASTAGDIQHMQLLLALGAPVNAPTLVPDLYEIFKPAKPGRLSSLAGAATYGQREAAELLIAHGADVCPHINDSSSPPLQQACRANDFEMVVYLLELGADINQTNAFKSTPLMYAVKYGSPDLVRLILSQNPDLTAESFMGSMATHWAIWPKRREVLELLLQAGANPDDQMSDESTLLHCAALNGWLAGVKLLVNYGANPMMRDNAGRSPLDIAISNNNNELADILRAAMLLAS